MCFMFIAGFVGQLLSVVQLHRCDLVQASSVAEWIVGSADSVAGQPLPEVSRSYARSVNRLEVCDLGILGLLELRLHPQPGAGGDIR